MYRWLRSPGLDGVLAWSWVPFAVAGALLSGSGHLALFVSAVLAFSFSHQTLTFPIVYGDRKVFDGHRLVFLLGPLVIVPAVWYLRLHALTLLAVVGATWNGIHSLAQRYGIARLYGRKVQQSDGGVERPLIFMGFAAALVVAAASPRTPRLLDELGLGGVNDEIVGFVTDAGTVARWIVGPVLIALLYLAGRWLREERSRPQNRSKQVYLASTFTMYAVAAIHPVAGLLGFVGSHAVEYYIVVDSSLKGRVDDRSTMLGKVVTVFGRVAPMLLYVVVVVSFVYGWREFGMPKVYSVIALSAGGLHFFFDGFIWKSREPEHRRVASVTAPA